MEKNGGGEHGVMFISHLDTVYPPEEEARMDFSWRVDGDRIYGPSVIDIKGGTALATIKALETSAPLRSRDSQRECAIRVTLKDAMPPMQERENGRALYSLWKKYVVI